MSLTSPPSVSGNTNPSPTSATNASPTFSSSLVIISTSAIITTPTSTRITTATTAQTTPITTSPTSTPITTATTTPITTFPTSTPITTAPNPPITTSPTSTPITTATTAPTPPITTSPTSTPITTATTAPTPPITTSPTSTPITTATTASTTPITVTTPPTLSTTTSITTTLSSIMSTMNSTSTPPLTSSTVPTTITSTSLATISSTLSTPSSPSSPSSLPASTASSPVTSASLPSSLSLPISTMSTSTALPTTSSPPSTTATGTITSVPSSTPTSTSVSPPVSPPISTTLGTSLTPTTITSGTASATASPSNPTTFTSVIPATSSRFSVVSPEGVITSPSRITVMSTFSSTVYVTTTMGSTVTTYAPPFITFFSTSTQTNGEPTTMTTLIANPTLSPDDKTRAPFLKNKGAAAGVFSLVGLITIAIIVCIFFFISRRRRRLRLERDNAISADLAAIGIHRDSLESEDEHPSRSSNQSRYADAVAVPMAEPQRYNGRASIVAGAYGHFNGDGRDSYDPYADPGPSSRVSAPPPSAFPFREQIPLTSNGLGSAVPFAYGHHHHQNSGASNEPLLSNWRRSTSMSLGGSVPPSPVSAGFGPGPSANMTLLANPPPLPVYPSTITNKNANGHVRPVNSSVWSNGPIAGPTTFKETQTAPGVGATSRSPPVYNTTPSSSAGQPDGLGSSRSALLVGGQSSSSMTSSASNEVGVDGDGDGASSIGYEDDYSRPVLEVRNPDGTSVGSHG